MAIYRKIHVSFWADPFVMDLTPDQKFFYLYLLTNDKTKQCGIYELPVKQISFDTGFSEEQVKKLINHFVAANKIKYSANFREIALKNWNRYNGSESPKVFECLCNEIEHVKDDSLIKYVYSMDRVSILKRNKNKNKHKNKKEEQEEVELNVPFEIFWDLYDKKVERDSCQAKWNRLTNLERSAIIEYLPAYVKATPTKKFRKNPETFLNNKSWKDEIIYDENGKQVTVSKMANV
jgi:hypothetical protein